jgi:hypothetical protein
MAVTAVKGKSCTFSIGTTSYTAWVTSLELNAEKKSETVSTWSEDVAYAGPPSYEGTVQFVFDPSTTSLGKAMETAFSTSTTVSISLAQGTATRSLGSWLVTSYKESMPADGIVTGEAGLTGSSLWTTTYTT